MATPLVGSMKRPLLKVAVLYTAGVVLADCFPLPVVALLAGSFVVAGLCLTIGSARPLLLGLLLVLIGASNLKLHTAIVSPHDLRRLIGERVEDATLRGTLSRTPARKIYERGGEVSWRTVAELEVNALRLDNPDAAWQPAFGRVTISTAGDLAEFFAGQKVEVSGRLRPPKGALAEGLFDYQTYLRRLGIYYQLQVTSTNGWKLLEAERANGAPLTDRFVAWGKTALARGLPVEDEALRLEWALTLGYKPGLTEEVSEPFIRAATYHIFAVDGLRIAIVSGIFLSLFRVMGASRAASGLLVIPLIWFYAAMTGFPASAIRATVMATVVIGGWALRRPTELINSLFAAALIILTWEPSQLFQAGFQLSFCVVFCIILLMPRFEAFGNFLLKYFRPDPWIPVQSPSRWQEILRVPARYAWETFLVSLAAWLGSMPLSAYYFHVLTPVSAPANLLAVPLCGLVLICNLISLLLAGWFPLGAEIYNHAGWFLMESIRVTSQWSAHWPAACYYVSAPALQTTALYYVLLLSIATGWVFTIKHRVWALTVLALLTSAWSVQWLLERQTTQLTILPVKGAAAIFVDAPGSANDLLIDCGNESSAGFVLKPFLRAHGVNELPRMLLTHGDLHHVGGAEVIRQSFAISQIDVSPVRFRSPAYRQLLQQFESMPGLLKTIQAGDGVGGWRVLHPSPEQHFSQADDNAIVLRGELRGTRVLLLSDLGKPGQSALFARQPDLRAEIVVTGLPQQSEPLAEGMIDAIQPRLIIIADSEYPASARANRKLRERLAHRGIPVFYTVETGAITLLFHRNGWEIKTARPRLREIKPLPSDVNLTGGVLP